jgi:8-oxo-dGTP pyrophosphatase MutT (NUDIX family)
MTPEMANENCMWSSPEGKKFKVSSVGILVHCRDDLVMYGRPSFLMIEKIDEWMEVKNPESSIYRGVRDGNKIHPWSIPAGRPDPGEIDPLDTAKRELNEETGLSVDKSRFDLFLYLKKDRRVQLV